ncbi:hypothetical protein BV20DRAFT_952676, partial [Pilatotrama ljubarskyi]
WTVCEDWETNLSLVNDIFQVTIGQEDEHEDDILLDRFADKLLFVEVIKAIMNKTNDASNPPLKEEANQAESLLKIKACHRVNQ